MKIEISSFGFGSRYTVDFDRTDTAAFEEFLASKNVYLSDRQVKLFVTEGEAVEFKCSRGRSMVTAVVKDITEVERMAAWRLKARGIVERWNHDRNMVRLCNMFMRFDLASDITRAKNIIKLQEKWDKKVEKLIVNLDTQC